MDQGRVPRPAPCQCPTGPPDPARGPASFRLHPVEPGLFGCRSQTLARLKIQSANFVAHSRPRMARPAFRPAAMRPRLGPKFLRAIVGQGVLHRRGLSRPRFFSAGLRRRSRVLRTRRPLYLPIFLAVDQRGFSVHMLVGAARCTPRRVFSMYKKNPRTISPRILSKPNCNRAPGAYCFVDSYFWPPTTGLVTALYYTEPMIELQGKNASRKRLAEAVGAAPTTPGLCRMDDLANRCGHLSIRVASG